MRTVRTIDFIRFFRQRLANLKQLEVATPSTCLYPHASFNPELNILLGAELDALSRHWAIAEGRAPMSHQATVGAFLDAHGGPAWKKCSHIDLLDRAKLETAQHARGKKKTTVDPSPRLAALQAAMDRMLAPIAKDEYVVLSWEQDLDLEAISQAPEITTSGVPLSWLQASRYGEIFYRYHRNAWVHALDPDPKLQVELYHVLGPDRPPHYLHHDGKRKLAIPEPFVLVSFERALNSFERSMAQRDEMIVGS